MKIRVNKKTIEVKDCCGIRALKGLMFDKKSRGALIRGNSIWMPFVNSKLDLLFLDKNYRIIEVQKALPLTLNPRTWKTYRCPKAKYCLEIRRGIVNTEKEITLEIAMAKI